MNPRDVPEDVDVLIDIPVVKVDELDLEVEDLRAQVAVNAQVRNLVQISVGAEARLGKVELKIEGVEAQALLKARLDNVEVIIARVAMTLDRNPELLQSLGRAVQDVGGGAGQVLEKTGDALEHIGEGAKEAVQDLSAGTNQALGEVGRGVGQ